jgi:hypothetical protein
VRALWSAILIIILSAFCVWSDNSASSTFDIPPTAYHEKIITPHWKWPKHHKGGTINALYILNHRALRDAEEIQQRFDISATVVPATGNDYKNSFDESFLRNALENNPDILVIAAEHVWRDLSSKSKEMIRAKVKAGLPLLIFGKGTRSKYFQAWLDEKEPEPTKPKRPEKTSVSTQGILDENLDDEEEEISLDAPEKPASWIAWDTPESYSTELVKSLPKIKEFNLSQFKVTSYKAGAGRILFATPFSQPVVGFNAFLPYRLSSKDTTSTREIIYLLAANTIRKAALPNKTIQQQRVSISAKDNKPVSVNIEGWDTSATHFFLQQYSHFGQLLEEEKVSLPANSQSKKHPILNTYKDKFYLAYSLMQDDKVISNGILACPAQNKDLGSSISDLSIKDNTIHLSWDDLGDACDTLEVQIYNPDRDLIAWKRFPSAKKLASLKLPFTSFISHTIRYLFIKNNSIIHETRKTFNLPLNRSQDINDFQTILWTDEQGYASDWWRFKRMRQLGVSTAATIGANTARSHTANRSGLRVVPTNIFVPKNRFSQKNFTVAKEKLKLHKFTDMLENIYPLGYSLADEPSGTDLIEWYNAGKEIIAEKDEEARVGYCGLWANNNLPKIMKQCKFLEPYSPLHLYDINLWRGIERDLYRSFRRPDGFISCWSQYAPWKDHEPYSRTGPWLWLFEEMNGISLFSSSGEFALIKGDLRPTHEMRWVQDEISEINQGLGKQFLKMRRQRGSICLLFGNNLPYLTPWVRALNRLSIPYDVISREEFNNESWQHNNNLIILPGIQNVTPAEWELLKDYASREKHIIGSDNTGRFSDEPNSKQNLFSEIFGIKRDKNYLSKKEWLSSETVKKGLRVLLHPLKSSGSQLTGTSTGEIGITPVDANISLKIQRLGKSIGIDNAPAELSATFKSIAYSQKTNGKGAVSYFAFSPSNSSREDWLEAYINENKITSHYNTLTVNGKPSRRIYLYPFSEGDKKLIGIVADYMRIKPTYALKSEGNNKLTAEYFYHGEARWTSQKGMLNHFQKAHGYNSRTGKYLGYAKAFPVQVSPTTPSVIALLPYKINGLKLTMPKMVKQGDTLEINTDLLTSSKVANGHIINFSIASTAKESQYRFSKNITLANNTVSLIHKIPYNAPVGDWIVTVRDALSGISVRKTFTVSASKEKAKLSLNPSHIIVHKSKAKMDHGQWVEVVPKDKSEKALNVHASEILRRRFGNKGGLPNCKGQWHLTATASISDFHSNYRLKYLACNDYLEHAWKDKNRILPGYGLGLGIISPAHSIWPTKKLYDLKLNDKSFDAWRVKKITAHKSEENSRIIYICETPTADVNLSVGMIKNQMGLFNRLTITPKAQLKNISMSIQSKPLGRDRHSRMLQHVDVEHGSWIVLGNADKDPDLYTKGQKPGSLLIIPSEWSNTRLASISRLHKEISNDMVTKSPHIFHWVIWDHKDFGNQSAINYMRENSAKIHKQMLLHFD